MAISHILSATRTKLQRRFEEARERTDCLFGIVAEEALYDRPIPERHRLIFYVGHLEAFDWNLLSTELGLDQRDTKLNQLFAFGIDPVDGGLPHDQPADWPSIREVREYNENARRRLDSALEHTPHPGRKQETLETLLHVAIEHRLMHAETLKYLLQNLPVERKVVRPTLPDHERPAPKSGQKEIPAGVATIGQPRGNPGAFGWDNEFETQEEHVQRFLIDTFPVTNGDYLRFVQGGGYQESRYWAPQDWEWRVRERIEHPHFWTRRTNSLSNDPDMSWEYRGMFGNVRLPLSWPVFVSHAEAQAYARWAGKKLPSEAQWHRAAYGTAGDRENAYPWGDAPPDATRGNFHHANWEPTPVDAHPQGASAFGVQDLLGNGWEWTATPFGPLRGFEPFAFYQGYSANFFDGKHFVLKGGSQATDACMLRRSFRNWFQPHYPYIYATFRCVEQ